LVINYFPTQGAEVHIFGPAFCFSTSLYLRPMQSLAGAYRSDRGGRPYCEHESGPYGIALLLAAASWIQDALVLQIPARLAPPVFVDDIRKSDAADWLEPAHWVADRQQGIRMDAGRQSESGLSFLLELQVQRRQGRPEAQSLVGRCGDRAVVLRGILLPA
jgi:hypothetical protein